MISRFALLFVLGLCACNSTTSQVVPAVANPAAAVVEDDPRFKVSVTGKGSPMILIPGLMGEGSVWDGTVERFSKEYECHVFTLAGFAGVPPVEGPFIPTMKDAVLAYIRKNKLDRPVIIGHSLGAHLAFAIASEAPDEIGPIVAIDGVPALGVLMSPGATPEVIATQAAFITTAMASMTPEAFAGQNKFMLTTMVQSPESAEALAEVAGKSDVKTVAAAMKEIMTTDLRDEVAAITSPVLLLGAAEFAKDDATKATALSRYQQQVERIPDHQVVMFYDARHFIMLDRPQETMDAISTFLAKQPDL